MQTVSAAHSNCVSTCYAARIWAKCAGRRMQLISSKHRTACSLIHSSLSHCLHINLRHVPSQLIFFSGRPEPYSAQWAYLPAINRSAGALSLTGREVIMTILMFTPRSTMNEVNRVYSIKHCYYTIYSPDSGLLVLVDCSVSGRLLHPPVSLQQQRRSGPAAPLL